MGDTRNAIRAANESFMSAFKRADAGAVAALYTETAKLLPPDSDMLTGRAAIESFWRAAMNIGIKEATLETLDVEQREDLAVETGRYRLTIQAEQAESMTDVGKYVVVWKKDGGVWRVHIDIWNTGAATTARGATDAGR
jgi:uncharacterized protein (TIGR02246 family)